MYPDWNPTEDRDTLFDLGFKVKDIDIENKNKTELLQEMKGIDIIFVAGGNTFYLLQEARKSQFDEIIIDFVNNGIPYIGSSAGTLLAGPSIELALDIDNQNEAKELRSYDGLELVDFVVLPHYNEERFRKKIDNNLQKNPDMKYKTIKITDNQAIFVNNLNIELIEN